MLAVEYGTPATLPKGVRTSVRFSDGEICRAPLTVLPAMVELKPAEEAVYVTSYQWNAKSMRSHAPFLCDPLRGATGMSHLLTPG